MTSIIRATKNDSLLLSVLGKQTLLESHANSPAAAGLDNYVDIHYSEDVLKEELGNEKNIFHIIFYSGRAAGYSKIIYDTTFFESEIKNITKLERFYLLKDFYDLKVGLELFNFNIELAKRNKQAGIWLYTWKENHRAIRFYQKNGFIINGSYDFKITDTLSNPNYRMYLEF